MDTLFWKNQYKNIKIDFTAKQYYKKYFYKLEIHAPGCKSICEPDIAQSVTQRLMANRQYNYGGSWWSRNLKEWLDQADIEFLTIMSVLKNNHPHLKFRTEEPKIQIYAECENDLKNIIKFIPEKYYNNIVKFVGPKNEEHKLILSNNKIILKNPPKFQYKVSLKEIKIEENRRKQVHDYLDQLGDLVHMTPSTKSHLTKSQDWIWGGTFYTNDAGIVEFVRLIVPELIREVCEQVCL
jgi:hypothetical protein